MKKFIQVKKSICKILSNAFGVKALTIYLRHKKELSTSNLNNKKVEGISQKNTFCDEKARGVKIPCKKYDISNEKPLKGLCVFP